MTVPATACAVPGCGGQVLDDGYCDECGHPAAQAPAVPPPSGSAGNPRRPDRADTAGTGSARTPTARTGASHHLGAAPIGSARAGGGRQAARLSGTSGRTRAGRLGAGITDVPPLPPVDAEAALLALPEVPEARRVCAACDAPVGRTRGARPGRLDGFCPACRHPYSFSPKLAKGDLVAGQYEVAGCLAFGGLGWVYLARDRNVSDRWVVLKGLLNSADPDAVQAAIAEREFLARVEHPLIVQIYNFVRHQGAGYIVMEYVGGTTLKDLLKHRRERGGGTPDPLPADQAIAYVLEILPAFQYLHDAGLLYCDFKPDNVIQVGDSLKLIDLGGVRRADDLESPIYGTVGYQAPEVPVAGPSVASDVYTIGRTLVSLAVDFRGNTTTYATSLPSPDDVPVFDRHDSLYRLLLKACADDPADRFSSCDELRGQLLGVLREVVSTGRGDRAADHSTPSTNFRPPAAGGEALTWSGLPALILDETDAQLVAALGQVPPEAGHDALIDRLRDLPEPPADSALYLCHLAMAADRPEVVTQVCAELLDRDPWEWRAVWYLGVTALRRDEHRAAQEAFNACYGQVPGEPAPKLALALACEGAGDLRVAERLYLTCLRTDANYTAAAAFGLARVRLAAHDRGEGALDDAVAALDLVPAASRSFVAARRRRAQLLIRYGGGLDLLDAALASVTGVTLAPADALRLRIEVLRAALERVLAGEGGPDVRVGDVPAREQPLRSALDRALRTLVPLTEDGDERVRLVDTARAVRPWTWT